jgi:hypothetical protein
LSRSIVRAVLVVSASALAGRGDVEHHGCRMPSLVEPLSQRRCGS